MSPSDGSPTRTYGFTPGSWSRKHRLNRYFFATMWPSCHTCLQALRKLAGYARSADEVLAEVSCARNGTSGIPDAFRTQYFVTLPWRPEGGIRVSFRRSLAITLLPLAALASGCETPQEKWTPNGSPR